MAKDQVAYMIHTNEMEKQVSAGSSYLDCFKGTDRTRTIAAMMVFAMQQLSGQGLCGQAVQFLTVVGLDTNTVFSLNIVLSSVSVIVDIRQQLRLIVFPLPLPFRCFALERSSLGRYFPSLADERSTWQA